MKENMYKEKSCGGSGREVNETCCEVLNFILFFFFFFFSFFFFSCCGSKRVGYGLPCVCTLLSCVIFVCGSSFRLLEAPVI